MKYLKEDDIFPTWISPPGPWGCPVCPWCTWGCRPASVGRGCEQEVCRERNNIIKYKTKFNIEHLWGPTQRSKNSISDQLWAEACSSIQRSQGLTVTLWLVEFLLWSGLNLMFLWSRTDRTRLSWLQPRSDRGDRAEERQIVLRFFQT